MSGGRGRSRRRRGRRRGPGGRSRTRAAKWTCRDASTRRGGAHPPPPGAGIRGPRRLQEGPGGAARGAGSRGGAQTTPLATARCRSARYGGAVFGARTAEGGLRGVCKKRAKHFVTGGSHVVTHHSTNPAHAELTSEFGWDPVHCRRYERSMAKVEKISVYKTGRPGPAKDRRPPTIQEGGTRPGPGGRERARGAHRWALARVHVFDVVPPAQPRPEHRYQGVQVPLVGAEHSARANEPRTAAQTAPAS